MVGRGKPATRMGVDREADVAPSGRSSCLRSFTHLVGSKFLGQGAALSKMLLIVLINYEIYGSHAVLL